MAATDMIRGRQVVAFLFNKSGGSVVAGDVVIMDSANDESFTTTTSASSLKKVGVAQETIANNAQGRVLIAGYASLVNVSASATRDYYLFTHTVAKQATSSATFASGAFGHVIKAGTSPSALIYDETAQSGAFTDPMTTRGDVIVRNSSNVTARLAVGSANQVLTSNGTDPAWAAAAAGGQENWHYEINPLVGSHGNTNWTSLNPATSAAASDVESSGAQNDEIYWDVGLSGGTWDFTLLHYKGPNRGIYTVSIDGSSIGTVDGYVAVATYNNLGVITGTSITAGKRRLKLKMATKNASSSSYFGTIQAIQLRRTA